MMATASRAKTGIEGVDGALVTPARCRRHPATSVKTGLAISHDHTIGTDPAMMTLANSITTQ